VGIRTHRRGTFFVNSDKESTQRKRRPLQPALRASLSFQLCLRVGLTRNPARRPQFAFPGKLPLPKLEAEAGCKGGLKSAFLFHASA